MPGLKICGVTRAEDLRVCAALGVDALGFNLWPKSRRHVELRRAEALIAEALPGGGGPLRVGVFVDVDLDAIAEAIAVLDLDLVQPHGDGPVAPVAELAARFDVGWIWVIRGTPALASLVVPEPAPRWILLDAAVPGFGGAGRRTDWAWAAAAVEALAPTPVWLAGGIDPDNAAAALREVRPAGLDVASGAEAPGASSGQKHPEAVAALLRACRGLSIPAASRKLPAMSAIPQPEPALAEFGEFGGRYVAETLMPAVEQLARERPKAWADPEFRGEYRRILAEYVGRPTPLSPAPRLAEAIGGGEIWLKREDLNHTGAHKINNCVGQVLLARRLGKRRIIAETGAGQHGVATATVCAYFGMPCVVYMGAEDVARQALNVFRMRLLGTEVRPVVSGSATLKDAINEALRDWVANVEDTHYVIGSVMGPDPYPLMVRELQRVIGDEARAQLLDRVGALPDAVVACVGGGSNAMGIFAAFVDDPSVALIGVEAAGEGLDGRRAATMSRGEIGVYHGMRSLVLQDDDGQLQEAHSISAGLDYPGIGPEHAHLRAIGRARYLAVDDAQALAGLQLLARTEGIIPALETAHAIAALDRLVAELGPKARILINVSGRGDKDMHTVMGRLDAESLAVVERLREAARKPGGRAGEGA